MLLSNLNILAQAPNGVARLRELILTLAVQGKLVPQDPKDEPASELLKKIRAEKDRLIAEGKIRRDKPLEEIEEDETPFELPTNWRWSKLGVLASKLTDGSHNPPRDSSAGYPMLSSQNVWEGGVIDFTAPSRYVSESDFAIENRRTTATAGDVLLTIVASLGRSAVVPSNAPAFVLQRSVAVIRTGLDPAFLSLFLRSPIARSFYDLHAKGTAQKGIYLGKLGTMPIPVPPLAEQSRIVTRVEELMRLCDALEAKGQLEATQHAQLVTALLATLTESEAPEALADNWHRIATHFDLLLDRPEAVDALEQTILQLAVRGLLVPQDPQDEPASELLKRIRAEKDKLIAEGKIKRDKPLPPIAKDGQPFALPSGWEWVRVGNIGVTQTGGTPASSKPEYFDGNFPFIGPGQITPAGKILPPEKFISEVGRLESAVAELGDILMVCIGGSIGKCAAATYSTAFNQQINSIHPVLASNEYVLNAMTAGEFIAAVVSTATGSATPIISKGKWDLLLLPLPPLAEQSRIVTRLAQLRRLCADLRQRLTASQSTQAHLAEALVQAQAA